MKFFAVFALIVAVASAASVNRPIAVTAEMQQVQELVAAIHSPSTDPATAALLQQQLDQLLGVNPIAPPSPALPELIPAPVVVPAPALPEVVPSPVSAEMQQVQEIVAAIQSPSTDPATAALLQQQLDQLLGVSPGAINPEAVVGLPDVILTPVPVLPELVPSPVVVKPEPVSPVEAMPTPVEVIPAPVEPVPVIPVMPVPVLPEPQPATPVAEASSSPLVQIIVNVNAETSNLNPVGVVGPEAPAPVVPTPVAVVETAPQPEPEVVPEPTPVTPVVVAPQPIAPVVVAPQPISPVEVVPAPAPLEPISVAEPVIPAPVELAPIAVMPPTLPIGVQPVVLPEALN